jgi:DNA-binding NarL/FixJ family response regulator
MRGLLQPLFRMVVMVADEASLWEAIDRLRPDVLVLDLGLIRDNSIRTVARLHGCFPRTRIVSIGGEDSPVMARAALAAGAVAFLPKHSLATGLVSAVEAALGGNP